MFLPPGDENWLSDLQKVSADIKLEEVQLECFSSEQNSDSTLHAR